MAEKKSKQKLPSVMEQLQTRKPMSPIEQVARASAFAEAAAVVAGERLELERSGTRQRPSARLAAESSAAARAESQADLVTQKATVASPAEASAARGDGPRQGAKVSEAEQAKIEKAKLAEAEKSESTTKTTAKSTSEKA